MQYTCRLFVWSIIGGIVARFVLTIGNLDRWPILQRVLDLIINIGHSLAPIRNRGLLQLTLSNSLLVKVDSLG